MKKLGLAVAVASALGVTSSIVSAYEVANFDTGLLVPFASFNTSTQGTAVGLISACAGDIYWVFSNVNSGHITDGRITVTKNDMYAFNLATEAGLGLEGVQGYLVFTFDIDPAGTVGKSSTIGSEDDGCLAGNAFYVDVPNEDVAFVPTAPLDWTDFGYGTGVPTPRFLTNRSISKLDAGVGNGQTIYSRYFIDNATGGDDTEIVMWTVCKPPATNTAIMYDDDQDDKSINFLLPNDELNVVDPETILGREPDHLDGFITWVVSEATAPATGGSAYCNEDGSGASEATQSALSYSVISSDRFNAAQTLYNPHTGETIKDAALRAMIP